MCKLSILVPTYNKEEYIAECLDSIFMQRTNFSYQVIIADDCSTDNTLNIVSEYQKQHPNIIVLTSPKNQKLYKNILRAYKITKTDYFTVLDPGDYWIDKYKIQKASIFWNKILNTHCISAILTKNYEMEALFLFPAFRKLIQIFKTI